MHAAYLQILTSTDNARALQLDPFKALGRTKGANSDATMHLRPQLSGQYSQIVRRETWEDDKRPATMLMTMRVLSVTSNLHTIIIYTQRPSLSGSRYEVNLDVSETRKDGKKNRSSELSPVYGYFNSVFPYRNKLNKTDITPCARCLIAFDASDGTTLALRATKLCAVLNIARAQPSATPFINIIWAIIKYLALISSDPFRAECSSSTELHKTHADALVQRYNF